MLLDTSFDFRTDANGKDPDSYSPTLRAYHKVLWSRPLPGGALFDLDETARYAYLHHRSGLGVVSCCHRDGTVVTWGGQNHYGQDEVVLREIPFNSIQACQRAVS